MTKRIQLISLLTTLFTLHVHAQQWGYATLIAKSNSNIVSLIDTNNTVLKQWTNLSGNTGYSSYLTEGGILWRSVVATGNQFSGGGMCGRVQKIAWDGTLLFDYVVSNANECSHHDICPLPNGNVMLIVYEKKTAAEVQAAGGSVNAVRWTEKIIELKPTGLNTATIVWQWNLWDHLVQNLYPTRANYQTSIVQHPELLNINYNNNITDWVHMNGIDYNAELDQIVVSSHFLNEMWVIDHSTTTAQAAGHSGGNADKGGDFLYRWGNPAAYGAAGSTIFNVVHDAHWVPAGCPRAGWLVGFNNKGVSSNATAVDLFQPPLNGYNYDLTLGLAYAPATYGYRHPANGYSSNMGSSQELPNGNMLICLATASKVYEINAAGTQLWSYTSTGAIPQAKRYSRCFMESASATVLTNNPAMCPEGSASLDIAAAANGVSSFTYNWAPATGLSNASIRNPVVSGIASDIAYTVTVSTPGGCTATATIPVTVHPSPAADAGSDVSIIPGQGAMLSASGGDSYSWSTGENTATIEVSPASTSTYTVTVTNASGCTATDQVVVTVIPPVSVEVTAGNTAFCAGGSTQLNATASNGSGNYTYSWSSDPAGFSATTSNPTVSPAVNTTYFVVVSDGFGSDIASIAITVHPLPQADAGGNLSIPFGTADTLTASGGVGYHWSNGENTASIVVAPISTTTYTVTVTSAEGCTATASATATVTGSALTAVVEALDSVICQGYSTQLLSVASGGSGEYTYIWSANGIFISSAQHPVVSPDSSTLYVLEVSDGFNSYIDSILIQVATGPVADAGSDVSILIGTATTLSASGGESYVWSTGETTASITVAPLVTTSYHVAVSNNFGCVDVDTVTVEVTGIILTVIASASDSTICAGDNTLLSAIISGGSGNYFIEWSVLGTVISTSTQFAFSPAHTADFILFVSDGFTSVVRSVTIIVNPVPSVDAGNDVSIVVGNSTNLSANGTGNAFLWSTGETTGSIEVAPITTTVYTVTVSNNFGCSASDEVVVTVLPLPLSGSISAPDTLICLGDILQLMTSVEGGSGAYTYAWSSQPQGFSSTLPDPYINPEENTVYTCIVSDGSQQLTLSISIIVNPLPDQPSITVTNDTLISSSSSNNQWFYYGNPVIGATGQVFVPVLGGSYQVQVVDANGCYSFLSDPVEFFFSGTTQALGAAAWAVAPNPASAQIRVLGDFDDSHFSLEIWNNAGELVKRQSNSRSCAVDMLPSGAYWLRVITEKGVGSRKFLIMR